MVVGKSGVIPSNFLSVEVEVGVGVFAGFAGDVKVHTDCGLYTVMAREVQRVQC